jgi:hypothetical protein
MQRTMRDGGRVWLNPVIVTFTEAAKRKVASTRAAFPDKTPVFTWVKSIRVEQGNGQADDLGDGLILGLARPDELPGRAFMVSLDRARVGIEITSDATTSAAPVIDAGIKGVDRLQFVLR